MSATDILNIPKSRSKNTTTGRTNGYNKQFLHSCHHLTAHYPNKGAFPPAMFFKTPPSLMKWYYNKILLGSSSSTFSMLSGFSYTYIQTLATFCATQTLIWPGRGRCLNDCWIFVMCCDLNQWIDRHPNTSDIQTEEEVVLVAKDSLSSTKRRIGEKYEVLIPPSVAQG